MNQTAQTSSNSSKDSIFTVPNLPAELITEILSRLPVKPVLKFRSVSKSWLVLTTSPEFVRAHFTVSANNKDHTHHRLMLEHPSVIKNCPVSSLFGNGSVIEAFGLDFPMREPQSKVSALDVVGSVNGLIYVAIDHTELFLWNPSIRMCKKLPDCGYRRDELSWFKYGFGYDEVHDDYKVVVVLSAHRDWQDGGVDHVGVKIYSLKSDSWKSKDEFPDGVAITKKAGFLNGKLHWGSYAADRSDTDMNITCIGLADEEWGNVDPPTYGEGECFSLLGVMGGDLCVVCDYQAYIDLWVMKEYGVKESWTKMCTIKGLTRRFAPPISPTLCQSICGEILLVLSHFMIYNPKDESVRYRKVADLRMCHGSVMYIESLFWPAASTQQN